jgi:hypothetical protein
MPYIQKLNIKGLPHSFNFYLSFFRMQFNFLAPFIPKYSAFNIQPNILHELLSRSRDIVAGIVTRLRT